MGLHLFEHALERGLEVAEIHDDADGIERGGRHRDLDPVIVPVQAFAVTPIPPQTVCGAETVTYFGLEHGPFIIQPQPIRKSLKLP